MRPFQASPPPQFVIERLGRPLEQNERGIILPVPIGISGHYFKPLPFDYQLLRAALLYFDRIDVPDNTIVSDGLNADAEWLEKEGILHRTLVRSRGLVGASNLSEMLRAAVNSLDDSAPGRWSLGGSNESKLADHSLIKGRGLILDLLNAIPFPAENASFEDIIEFKGRRAPELEAFRHHLDQVYQRILAAPDRPLAEVTELGALDGAISDALKSAREATLPFKIGDWQVSISGPAVSASVAFATTNSLELAASAGAACSLSAGFALKGKGSAGPFEYIVKAHRELR